MIGRRPKRTPKARRRPMLSGPEAPAARSRRTLDMSERKAGWGLSRRWLRQMVASAQTGGKELIVEEVERLGASIGKDAQPLSLAPQQEGTVSKPKCLQDGARRQHEVPDDPRYQTRIGQGAARIALLLSKYSPRCLSKPYLSLHYMWVFCRWHPPSPCFPRDAADALCHVTARHRVLRC